MTSTAARQVLVTRDCPVLVVPASSCVGLKIGAADLAPLPSVLRRVLWRWLACCRLGRGLGHFVGWAVLPALALTRPELLEMQEATGELGEAGVLSARRATRAGAWAARCDGAADGAARRLGLSQAAGQNICGGSAGRPRRARSASGSTSPLGRQSACALNSKRLALHQGVAGDPGRSGHCTACGIQRIGRRGWQSASAHMSPMMRSCSWEPNDTVPPPV